MRSAGTFDCVPSRPADPDRPGPGTHGISVVVPQHRPAGSITGNLAKAPLGELAHRLQPVLDSYLHSRQAEALQHLASRDRAGQVVTGVPAAWLAARHERPEMLVVEESLSIRRRWHIVDTGVLGSVEFAVKVLQVPLVVVLGHDQCGAVAAAVEAVRTGSPPAGYIRDVTERIAPAALAAERAQRPHTAGTVTAPIDDIEAEHVRGTARLLVDRSRILDDATRTGSCLVLGRPSSR